MTEILMLLFFGAFLISACVNAYLITVLRQTYFWNRLSHEPELPTSYRIVYDSDSIAARNSFQDPRESYN